MAAASAIQHGASDRQGCVKTLVLVMATAPHDWTFATCMIISVMTRIELLWFADCPNHEPTRTLLVEVIAALAPGTPIIDVDASDPKVAAALRFPGSPTIRINGSDVDPGYVDPGDYTPRCRVYWTPDGLRPIPARSWIERAIRQATVPSSEPD